MSGLASSWLHSNQFIRIIFVIQHCSDELLFCTCIWEKKWGVDTRCKHLRVCVKVVTSLALCVNRTKWIYTHCIHNSVHSDLTQHLEFNRGPHTSFQECTTVPFTACSGVNVTNSEIHVLVVLCYLCLVFNSSCLEISVSLLQKMFLCIASALTLYFS